MQYARNGYARRVLCIDQEDQKITACGSSTGDMFQMNFYLGSLRAILGKMLSTLF
jgi:hypothetical protein